MKNPDTSCDRELRRTAPGHHDIVQHRESLTDLLRFRKTHHQQPMNIIIRGFINGVALLVKTKFIRLMAP